MAEKQLIDIKEDGIKFLEPMLKDFFKEWREMNDAYKQGKITEDEYYKWKIKRRL